jgi:hypothetical protein
VTAKNHTPEKPSAALTTDDLFIIRFALLETLKFCSIDRADRIWVYPARVMAVCALALLELADLDPPGTTAGVTSARLSAAAATVIQGALASYADLAAGEGRGRVAERARVTLARVADVFAGAGDGIRAGEADR